MSEKIKFFDGVTLESVHSVLSEIIYGKGDTDDEQAEIDAKAEATIIPMNHNYFNPITETGYDTFIEYLVENDESITADQEAYNASAKQNNIATIKIRCIGTQGETVAHLLRYLYTRTDVSNLWFTYCNGELLPYVGDINCRAIDYFGKNSCLAWDVRLRVRYTESYCLQQNALTSVTLGAGRVRV